MIATDTQEPQNSRIRHLRTILLSKEGVLFVILVLAVLILSAFSEPFRSVNNFLNQGRLLTEVGLVALPMTLIILTGGIDLSVGSIFGLTVVILGYTWQNLGFP